MRRLNLRSFDSKSNGKRQQLKDFAIKINKKKKKNKEKGKIYEKEI